MKKILTACIAAAVCSTVLANLKPVENALIDRNTKLPVHWLVQAQPSDKATVKTILSENGKSKSVTFAPVKARIDFFGNAIRFEKGDEFILKAKIKGTGKVSLAYLAYRTDNKFLFSTAGKTITLTGEEQEISEKFIVKDSKDYPTAKIRPSLRIFPGAVCEVSSITIEEE